MVADIGGGTTDGIIFQSGLPRKLFTINIAGVSFTNDLSVGLGIPIEEAEKVKLDLGIINTTSMQETLEVHNVSNDILAVPQRKIHLILLSRALELASHLKREIQSLDFPLHSGLVLTGGGSEISGLAKVLSKFLKIQVIKATDIHEPGLVPSPLKQNKYTTVYDKVAF